MDVILVTVAESTPQATAEGVQFAVVGHHSTMPHANTQNLNIKIVKCFDSGRCSFRHFKLDSRRASLGSETWLLTPEVD